MQNMFTVFLYLQIDFIVPVQLEGFEVHNWAKYDMVDDSDNSNNIQQGVYSFTVHIGNTKETMMPLQRVP